MYTLVIESRLLKYFSISLVCCALVEKRNQPNAVACAGVFNSIKVLSILFFDV